jgi:hypothetical protein
MKLFPKISKDKYDEVWKTIDKNGDGDLSFNELSSHYGYDSTATEGKGDAEMSDEQILEALQMQATLQELQDAKAAEKLKKEEEAATKAAGPSKGKARRAACAPPRAPPGLQCAPAATDRPSPAVFRSRGRHVARAWGGRTRRRRAAVRLRR